MSRNIASINVGIKTRYKFIAVNPETLEERDLSGWCENILLTSGRNELAKRDWFTYCQVGTSATLPAVGQTGLLGFVAASNNIQEDVSGTQGSVPYYGWRRKRFRFDPGEAVGNLNEVAIAWAGTAGANCVTRALIVDINGVQVTVTPLVTEILDVVIEVRYYPPLSDSTGTVVFDGVTYDYIARAAVVTNTSAWANTIGTQIRSYAVVNGDWSAYDDNISTIDLGPNGVPVSSDNSNDYTNTYSENSYQIVFGMIVGPGTLNTSGWYITTGKLLRSLLIKTTAGWYQIQFDSQASPGFGVPKTNSYTMQVQFILGWQEQAIP